MKRLQGSGVVVIHTREVVIALVRVELSQGLLRIKVQPPEIFKVTLFILRRSTHF